MNVSILKRGKEEIFLNGGIEVMFELLNGIAKDDIQLTLNVIQCVGNVAEEPRARELLITKNYLDIIRKYNEHEDGLIKEQSKLTDEIILWEL